jgi:DNA-binding CsgD family transcriptional regulator
MQLARALSDRDLEIAAISQQGRALLASGQIDEGFRRLDEAMAAATSGEVRDKMTVADACCDMISACERAADVDRAAQWCRVTDEYARRTNYLPLFAFCRATYASILLAVGRWTEAEHELHEALRSYQASFKAMSFAAAARLAELRLLQGRDGEAEELLAEHAQHPGTAQAAALLRLARGDAAGAARILRRRAAAVENDLLLLAPVLALLVEALVLEGELGEASTAAVRLRTIAETTGRGTFLATASLASGLLARAQADPAGAEHFEAAARAFASAGMPLQEARARVGLARCLADHDAKAAKEECRAAVATFDRLGAKRDLDAAADLRRRLGVGARLGPRVSSKLTRREEEVLALLGLGLSNARIGARLFISPKTVEHHVGHILDKLDLETRGAATAYALRSAARPKASEK